MNGENFIPCTSKYLLINSSILENIAFGIPIEKIDIDRVKLSAEKDNYQNLLKAVKMVLRHLLEKEELN